MRVLRRVRRAKETNRPLRLVTLTDRPGLPLGSGIHAGYSLGVGERKIDREAWAKLISDLIRTETRGKIAPFARLVGRDPRTVSRWLAAEMDVREDSVRAVARALNRSTMDLLVRIGYYSDEEVGTLPPPDQLIVPPEVRHILEAIADPDIPDDEKIALRAVLQMAAAKARAAKEHRPNG